MLYVQKTVIISLLIDKCEMIHAVFTLFFVITETVKERPKECTCQQLRQWENTEGN